MGSVRWRTEILPLLAHDRNARHSRRIVLREIGSAMRRHHGSFIMIGRIFTSLLTGLLLAGLFGTVAGCNTVEGAGKDIQQAGQAIKNEAREHTN